MLAAAGFSALVAASEVAFLVLRIVGAVALIYLGVRAWRAAWQQRKTLDGISGTVLIGLGVRVAATSR